MESVAVRDLGKSYPVAGGAVDALRHLDLVIEQGECVTLLGPSGCGKSTLLRVVAGLVDGYDGEVLVEGSAITGTGSERTYRKRCFQSQFPEAILGQGSEDSALCN